MLAATHLTPHLPIHTPSDILLPKMSVAAAPVLSGPSPSPSERHAIGIAFGNSNSSIAITAVEDKAEVIANEEGGKSWVFRASAGPH